MKRDRDEVVTELRHLARLAQDAEREQKLLDLAQRLEAGEPVVHAIDRLPLEPR